MHLLVPAIFKWLTSLALWSWTIFVWAIHVILLVLLLAWPIPLASVFSMRLCIRVLNWQFIRVYWLGLPIGLAYTFCMGLPIGLVCTFCMGLPIGLEYNFCMGLPIGACNSLSRSSELFFHWRLIEAASSHQVIRIVLGGTVFNNLYTTIGIDSWGLLMSVISSSHNSRFGGCHVQFAIGPGVQDYSR